MQLLFLKHISEINFLEGSIVISRNWDDHAVLKSYFRFSKLFY